MVRVQAVHPYRPGVRLQIADEQVEHGGLAGAGTTENGYPLTRMHRERQPVHRKFPAEPDSHRVQMYHFLAGGVPGHRTTTSSRQRSSHRSASPVSQLTAKFTKMS